MEDSSDYRYIIVRKYVSENLDEIESKIGELETGLEILEHQLKEKRRSFNREELEDLANAVEEREYQIASLENVKNMQHKLLFDSLRKTQALSDTIRKIRSGDWEQLDEFLAEDLRKMVPDPIERKDPDPRELMDEISRHGHSGKLSHLIRELVSKGQHSATEYVVIKSTDLDEIKRKHLAE